MSFRFVLNQFGLLLLVLSGALLLVGLWSGLQILLGDGHEGAAFAGLLLAALSGAVAGGATWALTRVERGMLGRREALLLVAMSWIFGAALAGLPYLLWAWLVDAGGGEPELRSPVNCYFEAMSGLTTTGATILSDIEAIPRSLLLWRSLTHWLGGIGIVVLFVAVLPSLGVGGKKLFRVEAPGPSPEGVRPHIRETARVLLAIYCGFTAAEVFALKVCGLPWFEAINHTLATMATGGFSTHNASVGHYDTSNGVYFVLITFMVLVGVNFGVYYNLWQGKLGSVLRDTELRFYLFLLAAGSVLVVGSITSVPIVMTTGEVHPPSFGTAFREGVFTVVSIQTTTGFCSSDFNQWPFIAKAVLVSMMLVGGSAGSTAGGIKVIRIWIVIKVMAAEIERAYRPNVIRPLKVGRATIDEDLRRGSLAYVLGMVVLIGVGAGAIMLFEPVESGCTFTTAATASIATILNIGPGLQQVGAVENYGWFTGPSKLLMSLLMAIGRLEVFAIIVLFQPHFWRDD